MNSSKPFMSSTVVVVVSLTCKDEYRFAMASKDNMQRLNRG